tara:strand:- start:3366 stop:4715 length:1350 start_codon:yes stop_codon:yes gene_type:complete
MSTINDIYIDEVYIDETKTNSGANTLDGESGNFFNNNMSDTGGYKWVCAIGNKHASNTFTFGSSHHLNVCTKYVRSGATSFDDTNDGDVDISLNGISITSEGLIYVGYSFTGGPTLTSGITGSKLLGDQKITVGAQESIVAATRFNILNITTETGFFGETTTRNNVDTCGKNYIGGGDKGLYYYLYETIDLNASGSIRRKPTSTYPTNAFSTNDWITSTGLTFLSVSAAGDPHIKTLDGECYEFNYLGAFRLLEDIIDGEKLIINALSEPGPTRWKKNQYIRKLFIQQGEKYMLVDLGFRGEKVKILEEKGFFYTEENLKFHRKAKRYSLTSNYKTKSRKVPVSDTLPGLIRNKISFTIDDKNKNPLLFFELSNVNEFNLQPCRVNINLARKDVCSKNAKGCLISRKHANASKIKDIKCLDLIDIIDILNITEVPELEMDPSLINDQWK